MPTPPLHIVKGELKVMSAGCCRDPEGMEKNIGEGKTQCEQDGRIWKNTNTRRRVKKRKRDPSK
jgi:hypothetical protein